MSSPTSQNITSILKETRQFPPTPAFAAQAEVKSLADYDKLYQRAIADPETFWAEQAASLTWAKKWDKVLDWREPHAKWFVGGKLNASVNCLDRHLPGPRKNKAAILWEGEPGDSRVLRYQDLHREVCKFANVLKSQGIKAGDRVTIYMPMVPELAIAMLACAASAPRIRSSSAATPPKPSLTATTTPRPSSSSPPTAVGGAARWCH